jgi:hypothetical protein
MSGFFNVKLTKSTYGAVGVLVLVLLVIGGMDLQIKKSKARARSLVAAAPVAPAVPGVVAQNANAAVSQSSLGWESMNGGLEWGADPFTGKFRILVPQSEGETASDEEGPEVTVTAPRLEGIVRGPNGNMALVNGQLMRVGSTMNCIRLIHIGQDHVILSQGGRQMRLTMCPLQGRGASRQ